MSNFSLGNLYASRSVASEAAENRDFENFIWRSLDRYRQSDWGDLSAADKRANDLAVQQGDLRILAAYEYKAQPNLKIWIITEADRSATTVIFPYEYCNLKIIFMGLSPYRGRFLFCCREKGGGGYSQIKEIQAHPLHGGRLGL